MASPQRFTAEKLDVLQRLMVANAATMAVSRGAPGEGTAAAELMKALSPTPTLLPAVSPSTDITKPASVPAPPVVHVPGGTATAARVQRPSGQQEWLEALAGGTQERPSSFVAHMPGGSLSPMSSRRSSLLILPPQLGGGAEHQQQGKQGPHQVPVSSTPTPPQPFSAVNSTTPTSTPTATGDNSSLSALERWGMAAIRNTRPGANMLHAAGAGARAARAMCRVRRARSSENLGHIPKTEDIAVAGKTGTVTGLQEGTVLVEQQWPGARPTFRSTVTAARAAAIMIANLRKTRAAKAAAEEAKLVARTSVRASWGQPGAPLTPRGSGGGAATGLDSGATTPTSRSRRPSAAGAAPTAAGSAQGAEERTTSAGQQPLGTSTPPGALSPGGAPLWTPAGATMSCPGSPLPGSPLLRHYLQDMERHKGNRIPPLEAGGVERFDPATGLSLPSAGGSGSKSGAEGRTSATGGPSSHGQQPRISLTGGGGSGSGEGVPARGGGRASMSGGARDRDREGSLSGGPGPSSSLGAGAKRPSEQGTRRGSSSGQQQQVVGGGGRTSRPSLTGLALGDSDDEDIMQARIAQEMESSLAGTALGRQLASTQLMQGVARLIDPSPRPGTTSSSSASAAGPGSGGGSVISSSRPSTRLGPGAPPLDRGTVKAVAANAAARELLAVLTGGGASRSPSGAATPTATPASPGGLRGQGSPNQGPIAPLPSMTTLVHDARAAVAAGGQEQAAAGQGAPTGTSRHVVSLSAIVYNALETGSGVSVPGSPVASGTPPPAAASPRPPGAAPPARSPRTSGAPHALTPAALARAALLSAPPTARSCAKEEEGQRSQVDRSSRGAEAGGAAEQDAGPGSASGPTSSVPNLELPAGQEDGGQSDVQGAAAQEGEGTGAGHTAAPAVQSTPRSSPLIWSGLPSGPVFRSSNPLAQRFPFSVPQSLGGGELAAVGGRPAATAESSSSSSPSTAPVPAAPSPPAPTPQMPARPAPPIPTEAPEPGDSSSTPDTVLASSIPEDQEVGGEDDEPLVYRAALPTVDLASLPRDSAAAAAAEAGLPVTAAVLAAMIPEDMALNSQPRRPRTRPSPPRFVRAPSISDHSRLLTPTAASAAKVFSPDSIAEASAMELRSSRQAGWVGGGMRASINAWRPGGMPQPTGSKPTTPPRSGDSSPVRQSIDTQQQQEQQQEPPLERGRPPRLSPCPSIRSSKEGGGKRRKGRSPSSQAAADAILARAAQALQGPEPCAEEPQVPAAGEEEEQGEPPSERDQLFQRIERLSAQYDQLQTALGNRSLWPSPVSPVSASAPDSCAPGPEPLLLSTSDKGAALPSSGLSSS